jgi:hypothetical protein
MKVHLKNKKGTFKEVLDSALVTAGKTTSREPSESFLKRIMLSEHSPIRRVFYSWLWQDLPYWVSNHFVRHKYGIEHFVKSQREDRTHIRRDSLSQAELINHEAEANLQSIINISRKRLCFNASQETRRAWEDVINEVVMADPVTDGIFVPDCIYRGYCYEMKTCGYTDSLEYSKRLYKYRKPIKEYRDGEMQEL